MPASAIIGLVGLSVDACITTFTVCTVLALLGNPRLNRWFWEATTAIVPIVLLFQCLFTGPTRYTCVVQGWDDFIIQDQAILPAFALGISLASFRARFLVNRLVGLVCSTVSVGLLGGSMAFYLTVLLADSWQDLANPTHASLACAAAWTPFAWRMYVRSYRLAAKARHGCCHVCGYDLRGSVESGRCPECGKPILMPERIPPLS